MSFLFIHDPTRMFYIQVVIFELHYMTLFKVWLYKRLYPTYHHHIQEH